MFKIFKLTFSLLYLLASLSYAEIQIDITVGSDSSHPIGIIPFNKINFSNISIEENIENIISHDLRNSGKFIPIDVSRLPQQPSSIAEIVPEIWVKSGINIILIGQINLNSDEYCMISYQLIDVSDNTSKILTRNQYNIDIKWLRYAAHTASDEIFKKLTGIQGAFRTKIAFITHKDEDKYPYKIYITDYDGYNPILIHQALEPLMSPAWSPDGTKLAYVSFESGRSALLIKSLKNNIINNIANFPQHNGAPAWSPDGTKLAFALSKTGNLNLYIMDFNSKKIKQLTKNSNNNTEPSWFPDNQTLAFTSDRSGRPQIYKINIYSHNTERLSWIDSCNQNANVSKNGKFLVMVNINNNIQHIVKLELNTGNIKVLTDSILDETPAIAPNNIMLIYNTLEGVDSVLKLISVNRRIKIDFPKIGGQMKFPAWSPLYI